MKNLRVLNIDTQNKYTASKDVFGNLVEHVKFKEIRPAQSLIELKQYSYTVKLELTDIMRFGYIIIAVHVYDNLGNFTANQNIYQ